MAKPESAEAWERKKLPALVNRLVKVYQGDQNGNRAEGIDLPSREGVYHCLDRLLAVLFPGIVGGCRITDANLKYRIGDLVNQVYACLGAEVTRMFVHRCEKGDHEKCRQRADAAVIHLLESLPAVRRTLQEDIAAAYDGDPAAETYDEVIMAYPGIEAIATYRLAHELFTQKVPLIPRLWTERAHSRTGIDINPGATIGARFFIDHGTGVVIGETSVIGRQVAMYQGVTLGALAPAKGRPLVGCKRHPTIEDNVIIYAGATILGGETVVGHHSIIGGNVWLTSSVPAHTKVYINKPDLLYLGAKKTRQSK